MRSMENVTQCLSKLAHSSKQSKSRQNNSQAHPLNKETRLCFSLSSVERRAIDRKQTKANSAALLLASTLWLAAVGLKEATHSFSGTIEAQRAERRARQMNVVQMRIDRLKN
ncbi:uncharacterized protein LOC108597955 [Drosophila busckii]|uniref:uncharacterized protein LOC108597955 n=1 Tax=Drosophila busckii TaxID=30019 RepID=UPI00143345A5|nr:uncharacterized protein LOC108597955 [Drosophila busckii]